MRHRQRLKEPFYSDIASGKKSLELRMLDAKRQQFCVGDHLEFFLLSYEGESFLTEIVELIKAPSFAKLCEMIDPADAGFETKDLLSQTLNSIYSAEEQARLGVVGIRVKLI